MEDQNNGYLYFDIPKEERDFAISYLLDSIEKARTAIPDKQAARIFDQDIEIYLAHLLFAASMPDYQEAVRRYVSLNVRDVMDFIDRTDDQVIRYFIYKINADYLLVHLGIFEGAGEQVPFTSESRREYIRLARNYYEQAASYHKKIYNRPTAIGSVLDKLAGQFEGCVRVLHGMRRSFFDFSSRFQDKAFSDFFEQMNRYERETKLERLKDSFLDIYLEWAKTGSDMLKGKLENIGNEIKGIDPSFNFDVKKGRKAA